MPLEIGTIETVAIRDVWPKEDADFTPWLRSHIDELDKVLGLGLTNARSEVGAGDFSIDIVAETNFGAADDAEVLIPPTPEVWARTPA